MTQKNDLAMYEDGGNFETAPDLEETIGAVSPFVRDGSLLS